MDLSLHRGFYGSVGWRSSSLLHLALMLEEEIWAQGNVCPPATVLQWGCTTAFACMIESAKNKQEVFMKTVKWCITCADEVSVADSSGACLHLKPWKHYYVLNFFFVRHESCSSGSMWRNNLNWAWLHLAVSVNKCWLQKGQVFYESLLTFSWRTLGI